jgi:hypothetical protein
MPFGPTGWASRSSRRPIPLIPRNETGLLSWARALLQSPPSSQRPQRPPCLPTQRQLYDASHEVCSPSACPRTRQRHSARGLPHLEHQRPQVFSTSRRLHPPCACRPCFMPDPLMGLHPPEPFSSRAAVRRLRRPSPLAVATPPPAVERRPPKRTPNPRPLAEPLDFRGLLHARVRHTRAGGLDRHTARSSPGLSTLQGIPPRCGGTAFTAPPLMGLASTGRERPTSTHPSGSRPQRDWLVSEETADPPGL